MLTASASVALWAIQAGAVESVAGSRIAIVASAKSRVHFVRPRMPGYCEKLSAENQTGFNTTPEHVAYRLMLTAQDFLAVATELMS
jgi:hypothetical protein